jgi:hypothetical protein
MNLQALDPLFIRRVKIYNLSLRSSIIDGKFSTSYMPAAASATDNQKNRLASRVNASPVTAIIDSMTVRSKNPGQKGSGSFALS